MAVQEFTGQLDEERQPQVVEFTGELDKETTKNPLMGGLARILEMGGSGAEAIQRSSAGLRKGTEEALPESLRSKYLSDEATKQRQQQFTEAAQKQAKDIGYEPSTSLGELGDNPLKVVPFVIERVITSSPDMAGAALAFTPYVMTRANEILNERLKNDGKTYDQATVGDVTAATAGAIGEATLEKFATKRILPGGKGVAAAPVAGLPAALKRVGKEVAVQGGTESGEELASYMGESVGTKKGFQPAEAGERMLEAGIVGAGLGGGARGAREVYDYAKQPKVEELPPDAPVEPIEPTETKGERKDREQAEDRARAAAPPVESGVIGKSVFTPKNQTPEEIVTWDKFRSSIGTLRDGDVIVEPMTGESLTVKRSESGNGLTIFIVDSNGDPMYDLVRNGEDGKDLGVVGAGMLGLNGPKYEINGKKRTEETSVEPVPVEPTPPAETPPVMPIESTKRGAKIEGVEEININPNELKISKDVPQFKEDADEFGVVEPLKGKKYDYVGTPPIQVWRRLDGTMEVISGRHRWDLAKRTGAEYIPAQVFDEAKGFDAPRAAIMDAELNIRDGKGKVTDYVNYFKALGDAYGTTKEGYEARGLLDDPKGKRAYVVANQGSDELIQALRGRQISEESAYQIANAVPGDARLQTLGIKLVNEKPISQAINILNAAKTIQPKAPEQGGDLFGFDDSGLKLAEEMGKLAEKKQQDLSMDILTISRPSKNPVIAKKYGINIEDPEAIKQKLKELKAQRAAWENWSSDPVLVELIRREINGEVAPVDTSIPRKTVGKKADNPINQVAQKARNEADAFGLTSRIEEMFANRMSVDDVVAELGEDLYFLDPIARKSWVAQVGITLGVPGGIGKNGQAEFDKWVEAYNKRVGREEKAEKPTPTVKVSEEPVIKKAKKPTKVEVSEEPVIKSELPSFELEPEAKAAPTEKKAAAERETKEIADREREFFTLTPRTPEQGAGNYLQQDMIGAMGLTEAEYKKGIDKNATDPGEPMILRDVTASEEDAYNEDANKKVDDAINEELAAVPNLNNIDVNKGNVGDTFDRMSQAIEDYITLSSQDKVTAEEFLASAKEAAANGDIDPDVYDAIQKIYKLYPKILEGIRIEAISGGKKTGRYREAGHYQPLARMIRLFKDTSGVADPATVRHELAHTMEQMMSPDQKRMIVRAWRDEIIRASKAEDTDAGHKFFVNIAEYMRKPSFGTLKALIKSMPNESYYQYINPSEYWAVNAEKILKSRGEGAAGIKAYLTKVHEGMKQAFGNSNFWIGNKVFNDILTGDKISNRMILSYVRKTKLRNYKGNEAPSSTWDIGSSSWVEDLTYHMQDKYVDLKNVQKEIERMSGTLSDEKNPYVKETLTHSRISSRMAEFDRDYVQPLVKTMDENNVSQMQLHEYLLARHAPERNKRMGEINPDVGDMGSSITTAEAEDYMRSLSKARKAQLEKAAAKADKMLERTRRVLVEGGVENEETIKGLYYYDHYVPLFRKDIEYPKHIGSNRPSSKAMGRFSRPAVGSTKEVDDIGKNIILEHFRAVDKVENARVKNALVSLAISNPQTDFWMVIKPGAKENEKKIREQLYKMGNDSKVIDNLMKTPKRGVPNLETGLVEYVSDSNFLNSPNVVSTRFEGEDYYVVFNNNNPRAKRMGVSINNADAESLNKAMKVSAYISRFFASINTQYNIGFGPINFIRDTFGAGLNLSTTKLKGQSRAVMTDAIKNLPEIYRILRHERKEGTAATGGQAEKWYQYNKTGGATGSRARWVDPSSKEKDLLEKAVKAYNAGDARKIADVVTGWISDYNDMFENAVRFAAFKKALDMGLSEDEAANIAKNITVNFNRKGASTQNLGALYAFFGASVQGTARTLETMKGPNGLKIAAGGLMLGVAQAMWLWAAGYRDDEPAEFVKEKNFVFLLPGGRYLSIPMPLGFNVLPNTGRIMTEAAIGALNGRDVSGKFQDALSSVFNAFNPLGSSGFSLQTISPTPLDPIVAIGQNKDAFGKPIYREDRATSPTVGFERTRDTTSELWKDIAKFINYASGGNEAEKGAFSPTGDEVAFIAGQLGGGTAREIQKIYGAAEDFVEGKDTPSHKLPFISRLYGNVESEAATKTRFYNNVTELAKMEKVIDVKVKHKENIGAYYREHPAARLTNMANNIENQITQLNKSRKMMIERGATMEQLKRIEDAKVRLMKTLNDRYDKLR